MTNTDTIPAAVCPCGQTSHDAPSHCPRSWSKPVEAAIDAEVVAYLNDAAALLTPRLQGSSWPRATVAQVNAYAAEAVAAGRIIETPGDPYTWALAGEVVEQAASEPAPVRSTLDIAADLIERVYAQHGAATLSCECGALEVSILADQVGSEGAAREVAETLDHARFDHATPRTIIATVHVVMLDLAEATR